MRKKVLITIMAILGCFCNIMADDYQNYITVPDVDIMQGKEAWVIVYYHIDENDPSEYQGVELLLRLPEGITLDNTKIEMGAEVSLSVPSMDPRSNTKDDGDTVILLFQVALDNLPKGKNSEGKDFELVRFAVRADGDLELDSYPCLIHHVEFSNSTTSAAYLMNNVEFNLISKNYSRRVLEETSEEDIVATADGIVGEDVLVKRTLKANTWSTICLPFDMSKEQVTQVFGDDVRLASYNGFTTTQTGYTLNFISDLNEGIHANRPYVIYTTSNIEEFNVDDVFVNPDEDNAIYDLGNGKKWGRMTGILKQQTIPNHVLFLSGNKIYSSNNTRMKAFRGYLEIYNWDREETSNTDFTFMVDGEVTDIEGLTVNGKEKIYGQVYTLSGVHLGSAEELQGKLAHGIYIVNNKKVIVK